MAFYTADTVLAFAVDSDAIASVSKVPGIPDGANTLTVELNDGLTATYFIGSTFMVEWPGSAAVETGTTVTLTVYGFSNPEALAVTEKGATSYPIGNVLSFKVFYDRNVSVSKIAEPAKVLAVTMGDGLAATYSVGGRDMGNWFGSALVETGTTVTLTVAGLSAGEKLKISEGSESYVTTDTVLAFAVDADRTVSVDKVPVPFDPSVYIYLDANGGKVSPSTVSVMFGTPMRSAGVPVPTYEGMDFHGWYDGDTLVGPDYMFKKDVTLTAHWTDMVDPEPTPAPTPDEDIDKGSDNTMLIAAAAVAAVTILSAISIAVFRLR